METLKNVALVAAVLSFGLLPCQSRGATSTERIATGLSSPLFATSPSGDTDRLFVLEQHSGRIVILDRADGTEIGEFLSINGLATGNEQGLLGMAFDPNYATNGLFYVNINVDTADTGDITVVRRYQVQGDPATSNVAVAASGLDMLTFDQPQTNHNGGWIGFGPNDGYLYIATGDGGGGGDSGTGHSAGGNAQDTTDNLLGKMLRIDPATDDSPTVPYTIPTDNPFVGSTGDDEIWAYGLRNPYRSSFDRQTGDLWIGDVGQNAREEVDFQKADSVGGENYGWRVMEGNDCFDNSGAGGNPSCGDPGFTAPVYDYAQNDPDPNFRGNVIIGGYVYRGPVAAFQGHYIFADRGSNNIWKLDPDATDIPASVTRINGLLAPDAGSIGGIGSFSEDELGNLYILETISSGEIFRIATDSQEIVWNGDDASAGSPGDGIQWSDPANWTRGGMADQAFVAEDPVVLAAGSAQTNIDLDGDRTVAALSFQAPFTLQNNTLRVLSGNVSVNTGVTATIESDLQAESANHSIRKLGDGTLQVHGSAGQTVVKSGTLGGNGTFDHLTVQAGGTVAPGGSAGLLAVENSFTMEPNSVLAMEIGGTDPADYDRLMVGGAASLSGGTLEVTLIATGDGVFSPNRGDSFAIVTASGGFDMFAAANFPDLNPGLAWLLEPAGDSLVLTVVPEPPTLPILALGVGLAVVVLRKTPR